MSLDEIEKNREHVREISVNVLKRIGMIISFYEMDIHNAKKWERLKDKRGLRRWLFLKSTYGFYNGNPPTVEECRQTYKRISTPYFLVLNSEYWKDGVISDLIDLLSRKKAYTIDDAVELYEKRKKSRI